MLRRNRIERGLFSRLVLSLASCQATYSLSEQKNYIT